MTLKEQISADMKTAMKEKNVVARDTLRFVKGEIDRKEKGGEPLSDVDVLRIIKKSIENIKESTFDADEIAVLEVYMPESMDIDGVNVAIMESIESINASGIKDMRDVLSDYNTKHFGKADGEVVARLIRKALLNL
jgi:uncharacterized protein YqeY